MTTLTFRLSRKGDKSRRRASGERPGWLVPVAHDDQLMARLGAYRYREALRWAGDDWKINQVTVTRGYKPGWEWHRLEELREGSTSSQSSHAASPETAP